jgi:hypothetical protein
MCFSLEFLGNRSGSFQAFLHYLMIAGQLI